MVLLQLNELSLGGGELFEQLGCGSVGVGEFGLHPVVLSLQPLELLLCLGPGVLVIRELTLRASGVRLRLGRGRLRSG